MSTPTIFTYTDGSTSTSSDTTITTSSYSVPAGYDLSSVALGEGVLALGANAFYNVPLRAITFCSTITTLGENCLHATNLSGAIVIPDQITTLGNAFLAENPLITSITMPAGATAVPDYAFYLSTGFTDIYFPSDASSLYTSIGVRAFSACSGLTNITMPNTMTRLYDYAFVNCTSLASIQFSTALTRIDDWAFSACAFTSIVLPNSITTIGNYVFYACPHLTSITLPNSLTRVPGVICGECTLLSTINFPSPNTYTSIGGGAFWFCNSLTTLTLPEGVVTIENEVFKSCIGLTNVSFPTTLKNIDYNAFELCTSLTSVQLPDGMSNNGSTSILGANIFKGCTSLTTLVLPSTMITIPQRICWQCTNLDFVTFPPSTLRTIGAWAFYQCKIQNLVLPEGITAIHDNAFDGCILSGLKIPSTLTSMGTAVFSHNSGLSTITFPAAVTSIGAYFMYGQTTCASINFEAHTNITGFSTFTILYGVNQRVEIRFLSASSYSQLTPALKDFVTSLNGRNNFVFKYGPPCFLKGTLIQCKKDDHECWRPVESLRKGDLVKTLLHGFLPINVIGTKVIQNPGHNERSDVRLYKYSKEVMPELFEDLIITGTHSVLVESLTDVERAEIGRVLGQIYVTDGHYRLPACVDERSEPWAKEGDFEIFHFALENDDYYKNYGVFANGLLVESSSKRYIKEISTMKLLE